MREPEGVTMIPAGPVERATLFAMVVLGVLLVSTLVMLGDSAAVVRMHRDLSPAAGDVLVTGKILVCFTTGVLFLVAGYGLVRKVARLALAGVVGAALLLGYYLVELVSWGGSYPPVRVGPLSFGGAVGATSPSSRMRWHSSTAVN
jgi:hypothetical protein